MVGQKAYDLLCEHVASRGTERYLPHPALRRRERASNTEGRT